jgi:hypothetical protein
MKFADRALPYRSLRRSARFGVMPGTPKSSSTEHWATTAITTDNILRFFGREKLQRLSISAWLVYASARS